MGLFYIGGIELARELVAEGCRLFLDAKAWDIGQTVENAVRGGAALGADLMTVHGDRTVMEAARRGRGEAGTRLLAITVLTDIDEAGIRELGWRGTVEELVLARAAPCEGRPAWTASSPPGRKSAALREALGPGMQHRHHPAPACPALPRTTRSASPPRETPSPPAPTASSSPAKSSARPTRARRRCGSRRRLRGA